jgi:hypothetical protein
MNYYTYTIHFVDGYYYHGYHKHEGVDPLTDGYFGSPVTHKEKWLTTMHWKEITGLYNTTEEVTFAEQEAIRPVFNEDPYCLNANCNGVIPPELARKGALKAGKKAGEDAKKNKTRVCDPGNQEKGRQTARERGSGFHDPEFQHSEMMREVRRQNGRKTGQQAAINGQLAKARACINKDNQRRAGTENLKKAHEKARKSLEVITPSGEVLVFGSLIEAARSIGIDQKGLSLVARAIKPSVKGYRAQYL